MTDAFTQLNSTLEEVWARLEAGPIDNRAPANLVAMATSSQSGPAARMVVLRHVNRATKLLGFYTHACSKKVSDLAHDPRAELLIWDAPARLQIRLEVSIEVEPVDPDIWAELGLGAQLNYAVDPAPGTQISTPEEAWSATPLAAQMVHLKATIKRIETLHIARDGLRRAAFEGDTSQWIAP